MRSRFQAAFFVTVFCSVCCLNAPASSGADRRKAGPLPPVTTVGQFTGIAALEPYEINGVGLVVGLKGTGSNPAPSALRSRLIEVMKKNKLTDAEAEELLASPDTALGIVSALIPAGARTGDTIDVQVHVEPNSETTSLRGGWLMDTELALMRQIGGRLRQGTVLARARGPVVVRPHSGSEKNGASQHGRVLGGAKVLENRQLAVVLADRFEGPLVLKIQRVINERFHNVADSLSKGAASAKNAERIDLKIDERYRYNIPRYLSVVRQLAVDETRLARHQRMVQLEEFLLSEAAKEQPAAVMTAVMQLEGMGREGRGVLERVLAQSRDSEVRFFCAEALAYLGAPSCAQELAVAAREDPALRVFALAALVALREPVASQMLRELMDGPSPELRYGAFRALWTLDSKAASLNGRNLYDRFWLHAVSTEGAPMVHVTWNFRPEVVLFGGDQELLAPAFLTAGPSIFVHASPGEHEVVVKKISETGPPVERRCSSRLTDVLETVVVLGAGYPEVVDLLSQAEERHNLEGRLWVETLPRAGRLTARWRRLLEENEGKRQAGLLARLPGLFPGDDAGSNQDRDEEDAAPSDDETVGADDAEPAKPSNKRRGFLGRLFKR